MVAWLCIDLRRAGALGCVGVKTFLDHADSKKRPERCCPLRARETAPT